MIEQLDKLNGFVNEYYKMKIDVRNGDKLNYLLQKITGLLYYLETERSQIHDAFQTAIFEGVKDKKTVARAENEAHVTYPQMYQLRRVMDAGYRIADSIRTNISYLKSEKIHNN
jgi:hypothetical protein